MLGTRDYVRKNGFHDVLISLSGGIDSSLVAAIAVDALGAEHVARRDAAVALLERGQRRRRDDARRSGSASARSPCRSSPRTPRSRRCWRRVFEGAAPDVAEENLQARIRGNVVMTISNKFGWMVLSLREQERDGHRLRDALRRHGRRVRGDQGRAQDARVRAVPRSQRARRARRHPARRSSTSRPRPSCVPDQKDTDSLPEYDVLDPIIEGYVEGDESVSELAARGFDRELVRRVGAHGRPQRVQAPAGAARRARLAQGVRQGPAPADHQSLARLSRP